MMGLVGDKGCLGVEEESSPGGVRVVGMGKDPVAK